MTTDVDRKPPRGGKIRPSSVHPLLRSQGWTHMMKQPFSPCHEYGDTFRTAGNVCMEPALPMSHTLIYSTQAQIMTHPRDGTYTQALIPGTIQEMHSMLIHAGPHITTMTIQHDITVTLSELNSKRFRQQISNIQPTRHKV